MDRYCWRRRTNPRLLWLLGGGLVLLSTGQAQAHTTFPGLGEFASGFIHPLTTPTHLLVLVGLGLWLGQHAPLLISEPAAVFASAAAFGLLATFAGYDIVMPPSILIAMGLCVAGGVVVGFPPPTWVKLLACGIAALALGLDSGVEPIVPVATRVKVLAATWISLVLCVVNTAFYVSLLPRRRWVQVGVRVLGSWIVAIAFLLLAFALRR